MIVLKRTVVIALVFAVLVGFSPLTADCMAKAKKVTIKTWKLKKRDFTGDGRKDKVKVKAYKITDSEGDRYYNRLKVYINGKKKYDAKISYYDGLEMKPMVKVLKLKNGQTFLYFGDKEKDMNAYTCGAYGIVLKYKKNKMKKVFDIVDDVFDHFDDKNSSTIQINCALKIKTSGNLFLAKCYIKNSQIGMCNCWIQYRYQKGKIRKASNVYKVINPKKTLVELRFNRKTKLRQYPLGRQVATAKKGQKVYVDYIWQKGQQEAYRIRTKNKRQNRTWAYTKGRIGIGPPCCNWDNKKALFRNIIIYSA